MKHLKQSLISIFLFFTLVAAMTLTACSPDGEQFQGEQAGRMDPISTSESGEFSEPMDIPLEYNGDQVWCRNRFRGMGEPPFQLIEGMECNDGYYVVEDCSPEKFDEYYDSIVNQGFTARECRTHSFLQRDDCIAIIWHSGDGGEVGLTWYAGSPFAPSDGLSSEEAAKIFHTDVSISPVPLVPVDVTPEGFWERTGGQIFAVPEYSIDMYCNWGSHYDKCIPHESEYYRVKIFFVRDGKKYMATEERVAVADLDGDDSEEVCLMSDSVLAGVQMYNLTIVKKDRSIDFQIKGQSLHEMFFDRGGKLSLYYCVNNPNGTYGRGGYLDITLDLKNGGV